ncbi:MAG: YhfC family glutamic-type intramembrane protease [Lachnospiraceae bacterium]|nr:YhfC family intramembrane metalloprotease [Robinsoniella sp.]MDY3766638.1 YhfC family glutamic-type intramembrane protease [Lachnospiraceae bacterium]
MEQISGMTIACLGISAAVCVVLPLAVMLVFQRKTKAEWFPLLGGMVAYLFFIMMLEQIFHMICLGTDNSLSEAISGSPWLYAAYLSVTAALFEEGARYLVFLVLYKKDRGRECAVTFGVGFTLVETVTVLMTILGMLSVAMAIRDGGIDAYLSAVPPEELTEAETAVREFMATNPASFFLPILERICALLTSVGCSILVAASILRKNASFFVGALGLHMLQNVLSSLYQAEIVTQLPVIEIGLTAGAVLIAWIGWKIYCKLPESPEKKEPDRPQPQRKYRKMY